MGILYGHRCVLCGADFPLTTSRTLQLCPDCAAAVRREYRCNEVISIAGADGTIAPLYYRGIVRNAMKRFKFSSAAYCADWFAAQMSVALTSQLEDWQPDLITYMPIGFLHYRKRGYNQAELLAKLTAKPLSAVRSNTAQAMVCRQAIRAEGLRRTAEQRKRCRSAEGQRGFDRKIRRAGR